MRRLLREESGIAMGLAVILIVVIGVMGAGLLVFVRNDLEAVVEVNQGQRAFEMADAGVQAAERQLDEEPGDESYDGGPGDSQWSSSSENNADECENLGSDGAPKGVCLTDLYDSEAENAVNSQIEYREESDDFRVVSTGKYGNAKRRVEAVYASSTGSSVEGAPAYYTPGSINVGSDAEIDGSSFFSGKNIQIGEGSDLSDLGDSGDPLGDWENPPYNTTPREDSSGEPYTEIGLAAEGYVCEGGCSGAEDSIADGVQSYDSTTELEFVEKTPPTSTAQDGDTITYPFSRAPNVEGLLKRAKSGPPNVYDETKPYDISSGGQKRVHFIDAAGEEIKLGTETTFKGALVVRCGDLEIENGSTIEGIILVLKGDGSDCADTGNLKIEEGSTVRGYVYAGSTADENAIEIEEGADIGPLSGGYEDLSSLAYSNELKRQSWRELYE